MTLDQRIADGFRDLSIELPSWAFGNSGTRFKVFAQKGVPRDPYEKIADAAQVHLFTGSAPSVALHIPWPTWSVERARVRPAFCSWRASVESTPTPVAATSSR